MNKIEITPDQTFDEKYDKVVREMCDYLKTQNLNYITWTYQNGNKFTIRLSKKFYKTKVTNSSTTDDRNCSP